MQDSQRRDRVVDGFDGTHEELPLRRTCQPAPTCAGLLNLANVVLQPDLVGLRLLQPFQFRLIFLESPITQYFNRLSISRPAYQFIFVRVEHSLGADDPILLGGDAAFQVQAPAKFLQGYGYVEGVLATIAARMGDGIVDPTVEPRQMFLTSLELAVTQCYDALLFLLPSLAQR